MRTKLNLVVALVFISAVSLLSCAVAGERNFSKGSSMGTSANTPKQNYLNQVKRERQCSYDAGSKTLSVNSRVALPSGVEINTSRQYYYDANSNQVYSRGIYAGVAGTNVSVGGVADNTKHLTGSYQASWGPTGSFSWPKPQEANAAKSEYVREIAPVALQAEESTFGTDGILP